MGDSAYGTAVTRPWATAAIGGNLVVPLFSYFFLTSTQAAEEGIRKGVDADAKRERVEAMEQLAEAATNKAVALMIKVTIERRVKKLVEEQESAKRAVQAARRAEERAAARATFVARQAAYEAQKETYDAQQAALARGRAYMEKKAVAAANAKRRRQEKRKQDREEREREQQKAAAAAALDDSGPSGTSLTYPPPTKKLKPNNTDNCKTLDVAPNVDPTISFPLSGPGGGRGKVKKDGTPRTKPAPRRNKAEIAARPRPKKDGTPRRLGKKAQRLQTEAEMAGIARRGLSAGAIDSAAGSSSAAGGSPSARERAASAGDVNTAFFPAGQSGSPTGAMTMALKAESFPGSGTSLGALVAGGGSVNGVREDRAGGASGDGDGLGEGNAGIGGALKTKTPVLFVLFCLFHGFRFSCHASFASVSAAVGNGVFL